MHLHIIPRRVAQSIGLSEYFTGNPCKNGHIARRKTANGACARCVEINAAKPESIAKRKAYQKKNYQLNRAEKLASGKAYREKNREKFTALMAAWRAANPERSRETRRAAQARRRAGSKEISTKEMSAWLSSQKKACYWCGARCAKAYHIDHYEPLSRGGRHEISNLVIACPPCNLRKSAKDPYEFASSIGRLF